MNNQGKDHSREEVVKGILEGFFRAGSSSADHEEHEHLDADTISAFVEGNLSRMEAAPVNSHLVECSFCRHRTAALIRLDLEFAETSEAPAVTSEPSKVSDVLSGILGRLFGAGEDAVFAHQEDGDTESRTPEDEEE